jgi:hypothetical protein
MAFTRQSQFLVALTCAMVLSCPSWATDAVQTRIGTTQPVASTPAATGVDAARQLAADLEQARIWGLTVDDIQRARSLMQPGSARAAFSSPNLSPVEALGIHARSDAERRKYAELFARALHADTERIVAWMATYSAIYARLYPNEPVIDFHGRNLPRSVIAP